MVVHKSISATLAIALVALVSGPTPANSQVRSCIAGTTYVMNSRTTGWMPTNVGSTWINGPGLATYSSTVSATSSFTYSGTVSVSANSVVASAEVTFGVDYGTSVSKSNSWSYSLPVPAGKQGRILLLKNADKIVFTKYVDNLNCTTTTTTGLIAYVPTASTENSSYCWTVDIAPAKTSWKSTCSD